MKASKFTDSEMHSLRAAEPTPSHSRESEQSFFQFDSRKVLQLATHKLHTTLHK